MKFVRSLVTVLILALACAPVLAAECASACAAADVMAKAASATSTSMSMPGCHMQDGKHQSDQSHSGHKNCSMAGCHFTCTTPLAATAQLAVMDFTSVTLPQFDFFAVSTDLSPPIKPPA